jgi:anti-sigma regulatory factor (Ser/Thr protein kinase)
MGSRSCRIAVDQVFGSASRMKASFQREIVSVARIHRFVRSFFDREGIGSDHLFAVDLVVEEIFTNFVKYGHRGYREIDVELDRQDDRLTIRLTDHESDRFDITQVDTVDTNQPLEERPIGGLGIHLVRRFMDEIDYAYEDRRSIITLVKKIGTGHV